MSLLRKKSPTPMVKAIPTEEYFGIVKQQLSESGRATVRVTGKSMKPFLHPVRDTVEIVPPKKLAIGDVALFDTRRGRYILHRVTRVGEKDFDMRGDNTIRGELGLPHALLVGVVVSANRNGKLIECGSRSWHAYARFAPLHAAWAKLRWLLLRPAAKIYRTIVPRRTEEKNHA